MCLIFAILSGPSLLGRVSACWRTTNQGHRTESMRIKVRGPWMIDIHGRVRIFHGFNAVQKSPPWSAVTMNDTQLKYYKDWGFNAVRLGTMWSGVQPASRTTFNATYLQVLTDMVERARKHGIYVLLDMHQDVISSKFHSYDGVPRWLINKMPDSSHPYPWPLAKLSQWADGYLTEAVGVAFQCLYDNVAGAKDAMGIFWKKVASTFKSHDNVIGYELINEPWAGDIYKYPELLLPGNAGDKNLAPLYESLNAAIRSVDNQTIIFYEPVTWGMVFPGNGTRGSGFSRVPGGPAYADRSVMSWHYYCWILAVHDKHPYGRTKRTICDSLLGPKVFDSVQSDIKRVGGGAFLTEFGTCEPDGNPNTTETIECDFVLKLADKHLQSWTYWDSNFFNNTVRYDVVRPFARAYARAVAGIPVSMTFDLKSRTFNFVFDLDPNIPAPTEVFLPPLQYPTGFSVTVSPGLQWSFHKESNVLLISRHANSLMVKSRESISVVPK